MPFLKNSSKNGYSAALKSVGCGERATFGDVSPFVEADVPISLWAAEDSRPYAKFKPERRNIMSTNKTENYGLHAWEASDDFLRQEFNENFAKLDQALHDHVVAGAYTGDGTKDRFMDLGFTPRAVLILPQDGKIYNNYYYFGGLAVPDSPVQYNSHINFSIVEGGFEVSTNSYGSSTTTVITTNSNGKIYHYLAVR